MGWIYLREILLNRHRDRVSGLIGESARPPQLAASFIFISDETCDVRFLAFSGHGRTVPGEFHRESLHSLVFLHQLHEGFGRRTGPHLI
jgi:hypothetical protein